MIKIKSSSGEIYKPLVFEDRNKASVCAVSVKIKRFPTIVKQSSEVRKCNDFELLNSVCFGIESGC